MIGFTLSPTRRSVFSSVIQFTSSISPGIFKLLALLLWHQILCLENVQRLFRAILSAHQSTSSASWRSRASRRVCKRLWSLPRDYCSAILHFIIRPSREHLFASVADSHSWQSSPSHLCHSFPLSLSFPPFQPQYDPNTGAHSFSSEAYRWTLLERLVVADLKIVKSVPFVPHTTWSVCVCVC